MLMTSRSFKALGQSGSAPLISLRYTIKCACISLTSVYSLLSFKYILVVIECVIAAMIVNQTPPQSGSEWPVRCHKASPLVCHSREVTPGSEACLRLLLPDPTFIT